MSQPSSAAAAAAVVVATADPTLGILSPISLSSLLARSLEKQNSLPSWHCRRGCSTRGCYRRHGAPRSARRQVRVADERESNAFNFSLLCERRRRRLEKLTSKNKTRPLPRFSSYQLQNSARYRGVGTDLSKIPLVIRSPADVGSTEAQVARLSARVIQLTAHLKEHKKDFGATRGLMAILGQRRRLLRYLFKNDRQSYEKTIAVLNVRPLKAQSSRGVFVKLGGAAATAAAEGTQ